MTYVRAFQLLSRLFDLCGISISRMSLSAALISGFISTSSASTASRDIFSLHGGAGPGQIGVDSAHAILSDADAHSSDRYVLARTCRKWPVCVRYAQTP